MLILSGYKDKTFCQNTYGEIEAARASPSPCVCVEYAAG